MKTAFVQSAFYAGYFIVAIPASLLVVGLYFLTEFKRDTYTPPQLKAMDEKNEA